MYLITLASTLLVQCYKLKESLVCRLHVELLSKLFSSSDIIYEVNLVTTR